MMKENNTWQINNIVLKYNNFQFDSTMIDIPLQKLPVYMFIYNLTGCDENSNKFPVPVVVNKKKNTYLKGRKNCRRKPSGRKNCGIN